MPKAKWSRARRLAGFSLQRIGPTDRGGAEAVEPGVCALDRPTARLGSCRPSATSLRGIAYGDGVTLGPDLLAGGARAQGDAEPRRDPARLGGVVALVETEVPAAPMRRLGPRDRDRDRDRLQGLAHRLVVVAVRALDDAPQWRAAPVGRHRPFHPSRSDPPDGLNAEGRSGEADRALAPIRRAAAGFYSPPVLRLTHRPVQPAPATPGRCRPRRRRPAGLAPERREHHREAIRPRSGRWLHHRRGFGPLLQAPVRRGGRAQAGLMSNAPRDDTLECNRTRGRTFSMGRVVMIRRLHHHGHQLFSYHPCCPGCREDRFAHLGT